MNDRQLGILKFEINRVMQTPIEFAAVFALINFVPIEIRNSPAYGTIEYIGISDKFDKVREGNKIPEYTITVDKDESDNLILHSVDKTT